MVMIKLNTATITDLLTLQFFRDFMNDFLSRYAQTEYCIVTYILYTLNAIILYNTL